MKVTELWFSIYIIKEMKIKMHNGRAGIKSKTFK